MAPPVEPSATPRPEGQNEDSSPDESFPRQHRMTRRVDFLRCYRQGRRRHGELATLHVHPNDQAHARLGITASRKVGNAVVRQRVKRRVREIFRRWADRDALAGLDLVVHLKPASARADFGDLRSELVRLLESPTKRSGEGRGAELPAADRRARGDETRR